VENAEYRTVMPDVELICVKTDKFKTGYFSVTLLRNLRKETASKTALLPYVLRRGCSKYPNMESISAALDELYGASIDPVVRALGEVQSIGFACGFADDRYLPDGETILEKVIGLVGEILLDPATRAGTFDSEYVISERKNLCDRIRSLINDKRSYSIARLKELMCDNEHYGVDRFGTLKTAERITKLALTRHYRSVIASSQIKLFYCGSADIDRVEAAVLAAFRTLPRSEREEDVATQIKIDCAETRFFTEELDVSQGKLAMGFRLGPIMYHPDYAAIAIFNAVFGGSVTSKLFVNVREKLSLCYYAGSGTDRRKGVMLVSSGIDFDKYQTALTEIITQLDACRNGEITEEELSSAKKYVITMLRSLLDSAGGLEDYWLGQSIDGLTYGPEEYAALAEDVTVEDITAIAQSVVLDSVYFLRGRIEGQVG